MNKARLVERIAQLVNNKDIEDISDIRDESDRDGMRIVIELKRGAQPQIVLNQLFKHTQMQESFSMIFLAVVNGQPQELGLIQTINYFIEHRVDVVRRRTAFLLNKARDREHILEGYPMPSTISTMSSPLFADRFPRGCPRKSGPVLRRQEDRHQCNWPRTAG